MFAARCIENEIIITIGVHELEYKSTPKGACYWFLNKSSQLFGKPKRDISTSGYASINEESPVTQLVHINLSPMRYFELSIAPKRKALSNLRDSSFLVYRIVIGIL